MSADAVPAGNAAWLFRRAAAACRVTTGDALPVWAAVTLLNVTAQVILRRELRPGEFGTVNTTVGIILLMTMPLRAVLFVVRQSSNSPGADGDEARREAWRSSSLLVTETFAWLWAAVCCVLVFVVMSAVNAPRFSLQLLALINVLVALAGLLSGAICTRDNRLRLWAALVVASAAVRAVAAAFFAPLEPTAEAGQAALLVGGFVLVVPAMRAGPNDFFARLAACRTVLNRDFLLRAGAAICVFVAMLLFSSADRVVAMRWFGTHLNENSSLVDARLFDAYQTAGLLGRGVVWGAQPLLWALYLDRSRLAHTTARSLMFFWLHFAALVLGGFVLALFAPVFAQLFCGADFQPEVRFIPTFATVMLPLGLLQALGIFALASRRHPECFTLGGCAIVYAVALFFFGRQPGIMLSYMFGGALVSIMAVLLVGVVRWGRKQP